MVTISTGPVTTLIHTLIIIHDPIWDNICTRVIHNLRLMVLELVEVGHTIWVV